MQNHQSLTAAFPQLIKTQFPEHEQLKCPRCDSPNTKFCYYNNYNLSQPRHYCKSCKRYWTKGGTLRNIPIGGGCRKNNTKRPTASISSRQHRVVQNLSASNISSSGFGFEPIQSQELSPMPVPVQNSVSNIELESFTSLLELGSNAQRGNLFDAFCQDGPKCGPGDGSGQNLS